MQRVHDELILADPVLEFAIETNLMLRAELDFVILVRRLAVIVMAVDGVHRLMQRAA